jgi:hypothetical protein
MANKYFLVIFSVLMLLIGGCNDNKNVNPEITIEYLKENAKVGMTEKEIKEVFGQEVFRGYEDASMVWIFDKTTEDFEYTPDPQRVAFDEIRNGKIQYQLYINVVHNEAIMFSYFYKGDNNEVWESVITPDGIRKEIQVTHTLN